MGFLIHTVMMMIISSDVKPASPPHVQDVLSVILDAVPVETVQTGETNAFVDDASTYVETPRDSDTATGMLELQRGCETPEVLASTTVAQNDLEEPRQRAAHSLEAPDSKNDEKVAVDVVEHPISRDATLETPKAESQLIVPTQPPMMPSESTSPLIVAVAKQAILQSTTVSIIDGSEDTTIIGDDFTTEPEPAQTTVLPQHSDGHGVSLGLLRYCIRYSLVVN